MTPKGTVLSAHSTLRYVCGLRTLGPLNNVKRDALTFLKGLESIALDGTKMNEYILSTFDFDEPKTFVCVKPLYNTLVQINSSKCSWSTVLCSTARYKAVLVCTHNEARKERLNMFTRIDGRF